jgi:hypothetical protein
LRNEDPRLVDLAEPNMQRGGRDREFASLFREALLIPSRSRPATILPREDWHGIGGGPFDAAQIAPTMNGPLFGLRLVALLHTPADSLANRLVIIGRKPLIS